MNRTTACTYPEPWISRLPPLLPEAVNATISAARSHIDVLPSTISPQRPAAGWLAKAHRAYVGTYGHLLLGNFSVSFEPTKDKQNGGTLVFQVGLTCGPGARP